MSVLLSQMFTPSNIISPLVGFSRRLRHLRKVLLPPPEGPIMAATLPRSKAVDHGQTEAARSLGFRQSQTMTMVVLPQAVKNILPALGNEFVTVIKESSIVSVIGIADLMFRSKDVIAVTYISLETLAIAAILYFIMTFISGRFVSLMERKMSNGTK